MSREEVLRSANEAVGMDIFPVAAVETSTLVESEQPKVSPIEEFVAVDEPGAEPLLGDSDDGTLLAKGGDSVMYGDGGAAKTTLEIDLSFHLAAGIAWLGINVDGPLRVMIVENEGPRPLFRKKLKAKFDSWKGPSVEGRLFVWTEPWGEAGFGDPEQRQQLADEIARLKIDVLIAGPLTRLGMDEAGTLQHVRDFSKLVQRVRELSGLPVHAMLIHHENNAGRVSGAWEGACDTLIHLQAQGHGKTRLFFPAGPDGPADRPGTPRVDVRQATERVLQDALAAREGGGRRWLAAPARSAGKVNAASSGRSSSGTRTGHR